MCPDQSFSFDQDWPVDADWLKTKLRSILCGSTKEVYETGSQVADLHLMLSTMIPSITTGTCGTRLRDAVNKASTEGFPDLAREMGLGFLGSDNVDDRLSTEGKEDEVHDKHIVKCKWDFLAQSLTWGQGTDVQSKWVVK